MKLGLAEVILEENNDLDFSVLTDEEINGTIDEVARLQVDDPIRNQYLGRVRKASSVKGAGVIPTADLTAKAEFESRAHQLPAPIRQGLAAGKLQVLDIAYYSAKAMPSTALEMMAAADNKTVGTTNVNNRKLEANKPFLLTEIIIQSGVNATLAATAFGVPVDRILNGEFKLEVGSKTLVDWMSMDVFNTHSRGDVMRGRYKLENPKWIFPETEIIPQIKVATAPVANTNVKIILVGAGVDKA